MCAVPKYSLAEENRASAVRIIPDSVPKRQLQRYQHSGKVQCLENSDLIEFLVDYQSLADSGLIGGGPLRSDLPLPTSRGQAQPLKDYSVALDCAPRVID